MTNVNQLNKRLEELADIERSLWKAFERSEKEYLPPALNPLKLFRVTIELWQARLLSWRNCYGLFFGFLLMSVAGIAFISPWYFLPYFAFLFMTFYSKEKFDRAFAAFKLGNANIKSWAFGIDQPALVVAGLFQLREMTEGKLDQATIQSILKIQKASGDHSEAGFGVVDIVRKTLIGAPVALLAWIIPNHSLAKQYFEAIDMVASKLGILMFSFIPLALCFLVYSTDMLVLQPLAKRKRKRYFLILTLIAESYNSIRK